MLYSYTVDGPEKKYYDRQYVPLFPIGISVNHPVSYFDEINLPRIESQAVLLLN